MVILISHSEIKKEINKLPNPLTALTKIYFLSNAKLFKTTILD